MSRPSEGESKSSTASFGEGATRPPSGRGARLLRLLRWGLPAVVLVVTLVNQVFVPRLLQTRLSEAEYVAYVAVMAVSGYLGLAEGGLVVSVTREMSEAHGSGDRSWFVAEALRAKRVFFVSAGIAGLAGILLFRPAISAAHEAWSGAEQPEFMLATAAVLAALAVKRLGAQLHHALCMSTGRLIIAQLAMLTTSVLPILGVLVGLLLTESVPGGLAAFAVTMTVGAVARGLHAGSLHRSERRGVEPSRPKNRLTRVATAGIALRLAESLNSAAFPHILTLTAASFVPVAIPARTFANGTRLFAQQMLKVFNMHMTRRMAGGASIRNRGTEQYRVASMFLTGAHLVQVAVAGALAEPVFRLWLPKHADVVVSYLPGMLAEQSLLSAAMSSTALFMATDRIRFLGLIRTGGVFAGIGCYFATRHLLQEAAFGAALAISVVPWVGTALFAELRPMSGFPTRRDVPLRRYAAALAACAASICYARAPMVVSAWIFICGMLLLPSSVAQLWRILVSAQNEPTSRSKASASDPAPGPNHDDEG